jgi:hypothetical protein
MAPNPQTPIPNPQSPIPMLKNLYLFIKKLKIINKLNIYYLLKFRKVLFYFTKKIKNKKLWVVVMKEQ